MTSQTSSLDGSTSPCSRTASSSASSRVVDPALEQLLLDVGARRLRVPAILVVQPVLDRPDLGLEPVLAELCLDDRSGLLGLGRRLRVHEECVALAGDHQPRALELLGKLARLAAETAPEALEQAIGEVFALELDADPPIVGHQATPTPTSARGRPTTRSETPV